jgi:hypothetical protein
MSEICSFRFSVRVFLLDNVPERNFEDEENCDRERRKSS